MNWRTRGFVRLTALQNVLCCGGLEPQLLHLRAPPVFQGRLPSPFIKYCNMPLPPYCLTLLCFFPQSHLIILLDLLAYGFSSLSASLRVCVCVKSLQSCPTRCNPMDCSLLGSSVCGILQSRILEWVAMLFSWGSSRPRGPTWVFCTAGRLFTLCFHLLDYNFQ